MSSTVTDWKVTSAQAVQAVLDAIPSKWKLPDGYQKPEVNLQRVAYDCGILSPRQLELTDLTASELIPQLSEGRLTATEVTEAFCARAAVAHQLVNCLCDFFPDEAIETAKKMDEEFAQSRKPVGLLHGLPIAIKDLMDVKGKKTTVGQVSGYYNPPDTEDAALVHEVRSAGAIIFGRTTMPQTGMALETVSPLFGRTLNPYNVNFGAGGSSGGDGALVALHGVPCAPLSTDIGGSIRAPGAFNGLYAMRPSADRVPRTGMASYKKGQISIRSSTGPNCRSMSDLKLLTKIILEHEAVPFEPTCIPGAWKEVPLKPKLAIGIMSTDGVVTPHPPVSRALKEVAAKLRAAGHVVVEFPPPTDLWQAALTTWGLYFQPGAQDVLDGLAKTGEPPIPQFKYNLEVFKVREQTTMEIYLRHKEQNAVKAAFANAWKATMSTTATGGQPIDCIICPSASMAGSPHDFPLWWGYTTIWNLIDYPSIIMPFKEFKIDLTLDAKEADYKPLENPFDKPNWEICEWH